MTVMPIHPHLSYLGQERECKLLLQVPAIEGSSTLKGYEDWIPFDAVSATWVLPNEAQTTGRRRRRNVTPGRVVLRLPVDGAALFLVQAAVQGKSFDTFELHHVLVADTVHAPLRQVFDNVVVEAARTDSVGALPILQLEFAYEEVHMTWSDIGRQGATEVTAEVEWDLTTDV